jgi:hypothetical protein
VVPRACKAERRPAGPLGPDREGQSIDVPQGQRKNLTQNGQEPPTFSASPRCKNTGFVIIYFNQQRFKLLPPAYAVEALYAAAAPRRRMCHAGSVPGRGWGWGDGEEGAGGKGKGGLEGGGGGRGGGDGGSEGGMGGRGPETRDAAAAAQPELLGRHKPLK